MGGSGRTRDREFFQVRPPPPHEISQKSQIMQNPETQKQQWVQPEVSEVAVSMECTSYAEILGPSTS